MTSTTTVQDILLLRGARRGARAWHRRFVFDRAMRQFIERPERAFDADSDILDRLIYGWGNHNYSAWQEFLIAALRETQAARGPVLECGSGLSTLLVGVVAARNGNTVWSLEHHPGWAECVDKALRTYAIEAVRVDVEALKDYGEFHWYQPSFEAMPPAFDLVLCDGPPGKTPGGRYGFLPVMRPRLAAGCCIIVDDAEREQERTIAGRWARELGVTYRMLGRDKPYIEIRVSETRVPTAKVV